MPPKSIFRQPDAKHFQLVHRSQRDPLINDPNASQHVLKPFERENVKKGKSRADLEEILSLEPINDTSRDNPGEATLYGVYYDDSDYDYMQHLRPVGLQEDGVESVLIEASAPSSNSKSRAKKNPGFNLPDGVLASTSELPRTYESQQAIPESIAGFQPNMDPHLRQVLEALEDDAFVDDNLEDDFFGQLVADGERKTDDNADFDFEDEFRGDLEAEESGEEGWEQRFVKFKEEQRKSIQHHGSDDGSVSEGDDTVGTLPAISVIGGKRRRRKGGSDASGYSMSSSSMYRNEALQTLDERFNQIILKQYNEDGENIDNDEIPLDDDSDEAPELITSREDFDGMVNEFLNQFEILGRKMKPKLEGESGTDKLDTIRRAMGQDDRIRIARDGEDDEGNDLLLVEEDKKDHWDCETILTTYSNLENHPRLIRARDSKPVPKILLDPRTGLPFVTSVSQGQPIKGQPITRARVSFSNSENTDESDSDSTDVGRRQAAVGRPRNETKEDKKARKAAVKAERQTRRVEKKAAKEQFGAELKDQKKRIGNKETRLKKL